MHPQTACKSASSLTLGVALLLTSACSPTGELDERNGSPPPSTTTERLRELANLLSPAVSMSTVAETEQIREQNNLYIDDVSGGSVSPKNCKNLLIRVPELVTASPESSTASSPEAPIQGETAITVGVYKSGSELVSETQKVIRECPDVELETPSYSITQKYSTLPKSALDQTSKDCINRTVYYRLSIQTKSKSEPEQLPAIGIYYGMITSSETFIYEMRIGNNSGIEVDPSSFAGNANRVLTASQCGAAR